MNPTTILASDEEVLAAAKLIKDFERQYESRQVQGGEVGVANNEDANDQLFDNAELWRARQLRDSAVHPDTGEIVPRPFRMSGYVPFNGPVCVAMMVASSTPALLFWNWVNQSQNALVNFFNRNASSPTSTQVLVQSYLVAVGGALSVAFGASQLIQRRFDAATARRLMTFVALPSSMIASSLNAYIMRAPEIDAGITLYDEDLKTEAAPGLRSNIAAKKAVMETVYSRVILQFPTFFVPPLMMMIPPIAALAASSAAFSITANTFFTLVGFGLGLPAAIAVFPQIGSLEVSDLEPEIRAAAEARGMKRIYFNKGL